MARAKITKELFMEIPDKVGLLAEVTSKIADKGINIEAFYAYAQDNKAYFGIVTSDVEATRSILSDLQPQEKEVVMVELENKVGAVKELALKLKEANINLTHAYGSACSCLGGDCRCFLIFASNNNKKALEIL